MKLIHLICALLIASCSIQAQVQGTDTIKGKIYYRYTIERGMGLYQVSKRFGTTQEQILKLNPQLRHEGLNYGQSILVPAPSIVQEVKVNAESATVVDPAFIENEKPVTYPEDCKHELRLHKHPRIELMSVEEMQWELIDTTTIDTMEVDTVRLALMMPLYANTTKRTATMNRFMDFYIGSLIAIYEAQNEQKYIELYTYDVDKTTQGIERCIDDSVLRNVDAIIGPAYAQQVERMAEQTLLDSIWMIAPFASEIHLKEANPYLLKFNPSSKDEANALAEYLLLSDDSVNCVVIQAREGENIPNSIQKLHSALDANGITKTTTTIHDLLVDSAENAFVANVENIVIFNTEKYKNLEAVIPHLQKLQTQYPITLYSRYTWQTEDIPFPQIYTSIFHEEIEEPAEYRGIYERYFSTPPAEYPRYDLLGYDLTKHLLSLLPTTDSLAWEELWNGVQTKIMYQQAEDGYMYNNMHINILRKH